MVAPCLPQNGKNAVRYADYNAAVGILGEDDNGEDLGVLEKKLVEKHQQSRQASQAVASQPTSPSQATSGRDGTSSTPRSSLTSPEPVRDKEKDRDHDHDKRKSAPPGPPEEKKQDEEEVEALSEMMCSLVTNTCGETRYIGTASSPWVPSKSVGFRAC